MKKYFIVSSFLLLSAITSAQPFLCFTDLTSGPSSGNSDDSQKGQIKNKDGAIVTLWGKRLGDQQLNSSIYVDGVKARIYSWGNATQPANLFDMHQMQKVSFQIPSEVKKGIINIVAEVNGEKSNALSFTVREGNIRFVSSKGSDKEGDGSFQSPWKTLDNELHDGALKKIFPGDVLYIRDSFVHEALVGDRACIDIGDPGTYNMPKAIVAYPNSYAMIGTVSVPKTFSLWVSGIGLSSNWTISQLHLIAKHEAISLFHNFRVVGNYITAPQGDGPTGAVTGLGNNLYLLGNELTNIGHDTTSKLYHPIYFQSHEACSGPRLPTERNREIAWNYLHDNLSYDGINIYRECGSSAYMTDHKVHSNVILNQTGCGIRVGDYVVGENHIYNNIIINAGLGPDPPKAEAMHVPMLIHAGWNDTTSNIHVYNNTIYGGGFDGGADWASSMVGFNYNRTFTLDFRNNLVYSTSKDIDYLNSRFEKPVGVFNNVWYGNGPSPSWDGNGYSDSPMFIDEVKYDFHLKSNSSLIGKGSKYGINNEVLPTPLRDFDCKERSKDGALDIGAFEYISNITYNKDLQNSEVVIYPNPFSDKLFIDNIVHVSKITITNILGQVVYSDMPTRTIDLSGIKDKVLVVNIGLKDGSSRVMKFVSTY